MKRIKILVVNTLKLRIDRLTLRIRVISQIKDVACIYFKIMKMKNIYGENEQVAK
jgi:hypothetical protein